MKLNPKETCEFLNVTRARLYQFRIAHRIKGIKTEKGYHYQYEDLLKLAEQIKINKAKQQKKTKQNVKHIV